MKESIVLAYSGGLDTASITHWLSANGYAVICLCVDVGQQDETSQTLEQKAYLAGAHKFIMEDAREEFVRDFVFPALQWGAVYEKKYLLGTALARPLIAKKQVETARREGTSMVAHGATPIMIPDTVRFELTCYAMDPDIQIISPWRMPEFYERFPGRKSLVEYCMQHGIPVDATADKIWTSDENAVNKTYAGGDLEDLWNEPQDAMFQWTSSIADAPGNPEEITIGFEQGLPVTIDGEARSPYNIMRDLNQLGGKHGIGRVDTVEEFRLGWKGRDVLENPAMRILQESLLALESITLDKSSLFLKEDLMPRFARDVHDGYWFRSDVQLLIQLIKNMQQPVTGEIRLKLHKGNVIVTGRKSENSLYNADAISYANLKGKYNDPAHLDGYIKLISTPLKLQNHES